MDAAAALAAFDAQVRRRPDDKAHVDGPVIRRISDGWAGVVWSELDEHTADEVIAAQVRLFGNRRWEWKHYSYDRPADLPRRLLAHGFVAEPVEALMVAEIAELDLAGPAPRGIELVAVTDRTGADALVAVHEQVFGGDYAAVGDAVLDGVARGETAGVVAMAGDTPVSAARVEFHRGTDFASLWGGGTLAQWRGRGVFRALVAHRARLAAERGFRYLQVDASDDSRPILGRLGFSLLATTTPYVHNGQITVDGT